jgi:transposase
MTDEEWKLVRPLVETVQKGPGPRRQVNVRVVLNGLSNCGTDAAGDPFPKNIRPTKPSVVIFICGARTAALSRSMMCCG